MSAHVLLNLLSMLRKSDKLKGLQSILSFFRKEFNKFNNTGAYMTLELIENRILGVKTSIFCHPLCNIIKDV